MMAAGEARAVWQRTVNRYLVQEDAKRAPKFTSSHSSSSTKQVQEDSVSSPPVVHPQNQSPFMPLNIPQLLDHHPHHLHVKTPLEAEVNLSEKKPELGAKETKESYDSFGKDESSEIPFDPTSPWNPLSSEKAGPWWRTTDKDELASLVAQRSLDFVENCNLPTPQKMKRSSYYGSSPHEQGPSSCKNRREEASSSSECDLSKSELLEALRRSQTRAREAENMAKEACAEKEDLVKLLFKQASELFGYRQLMQLLQLEALYLQIKNKKIEKPPRDSIPWKGRKEGRKRRSKRGKASGLFGLALGMSLVGAGLLLGWTVGWMQILSF
ncbi:BnaC04g50880D [Brassica napus]|uniref:(rape) hypothetical protein n=1 Tax=Brassica napus TaxID=3708 RepID=A0A078GQ35_BRANA|nr:uncharacterized protein BNAC04G50880D isoform X1 [Brassica napus]XP_013717040.1 uncharacterized protein BNAC04G50880D isoform X1 [Brassica napus]CAF1873951.1 unnamed protein product [Brassica napus]CDY27317.1 BnaC04g50880D [Brassica napus]